MDENGVENLHDGHAHAAAALGDEFRRVVLLVAAAVAAHEQLHRQRQEHDAADYGHAHLLQQTKSGHRLERGDLFSRNVNVSQIYGGR